MTEETQSYDFARARKIRVLIPTTTGIAEVLRIVRERRELARSTVRLNLDMKPAGIDAAYNEFVNSPGGLIERYYGHNRFRVDVSAAIDGGNSWQAGLMLAHALQAAGRLAMRNEKGEGDSADAVVWITGELRIDQRVVKVGEVARKLDLSREQLAELSASEIPVLVCLPQDNSLEPDVQAALTGVVGPKLPLTEMNEILRILGLPMLEPDLASGPKWRGNPYRGLAAFDEEHREIFFGRREARERACSVLLNNADAEGRSFLLISGQSGAGKSSLVRAGLIGDLQKARGGTWRAVVTTPRRAVSESLKILAESIIDALKIDRSNRSAAILDAMRHDPHEASNLIVAGLDAIAAERAHLIVVIDQLEELLLGSAEARGDNSEDSNVEEYGRVLRCFAETRRIWVIATLRSDFFHHIDRSASLAGLVRETNTFLLPRPQQHELRESIRRPAMLVGVSFEGQNPQDPSDPFSLADQIEQEATQFGDHPSLPLVEFALSLLFERRSPQGIITHKAYSDLGRLSGAIARFADQSLDREFEHALDRFELEEALKWVLLDLTHIERLEAESRLDTPKPKAIGRRLQITRSDMGVRRRVIDLLVEMRLVEIETARGETTARVAHDALFECWPRLSSLVSNYRDDLMLRDELLQQRRHWAAGGRRSWFLQSEALEEAIALRARWAGNLDPELVEFIDVSSRRSEAQRRSWTLLRGVVVATIGLAAVVAAVGWWQAARAYRVAQENLLAAVEANEATSERVLTIQYSAGLRAGVAQQLIDDAARRLSLLSEAELSGAGAQVLGSGVQAEVLMALSSTLLNYGEIELEQEGVGRALIDRLASVQSALDAAAKVGAPDQKLSLMRARLSLSQGNIALQSGEFREAGPHYANALQSLVNPSPEGNFLKAQILQGRGNAELVQFASIGDVSSAARARTYFTEALQELERLSDHEANGPRVLREVLAVQLSLAELEVGQGDLSGARQRLMASLSRLTLLPEATQASPALMYERVRSTLLLTYVCRCIGRVPEARTAFVNFASTLAVLTGLDPLNPRLRKDRLLGQIEDAELSEAEGAHRRANELRAGAAKEWEGLRRENPDIFSIEEELPAAPRCGGA